MKLEDLSQNLPIRLGSIQIIAFLLLAVLGGRLYYLQVTRGKELEDKAFSQRIRVIPIPASRGAIFDRHGRLLVDSTSTYNIVLSHEPIKNINPVDRLEDYAQGLGLDREYLLERLNIIKKRPEFETMVLKENVSQDEIIWVESHQIEFPELRVELQPQRNYPLGSTLAHVLGYVGEISPKQLEKPEYQEKGFNAGDIIGKGGLEQYYDDVLRGRKGYRKVLVDSRGKVQEELEKVEPQAGQDLITTIDLDLQLAAEEQLAKSATKRGMIIAMDPNNGEIMAMASAPTFDPNVFVKESTTPEGRKKISAYWQNEERPLLNRAIQGRYPPGSTWKIPISAAGFQQGIITEQDNAVACNAGITIGGKFTRCMGSHGTPPLKYAITKSCDGYYYRLAIKMGIEGLVNMAETFGYDKPSGIDLPNEKTPQTPKTFRAVREKLYGHWIEINSVYAGIGQDTVNVTPISMLRAVSAIGADGKMFVPHLLKEFREIGAIGQPGEATYREAKSSFGFAHPEPKILALTKGQHDLIVQGMIGSVAGGTSKKAGVGGLQIAGKTGTAQVVSLGLDKGKNRDHAWFVSFAPAYKPELAIIGLIENSGFGGDNAAPAVRGVYQAYLAKRGAVPDNQQVALK